MTDSQEWWPADYGHYGGLFIRMSWHAAGTYRTFDGRGGAGTGQQRFMRSTAGRTTPASTRPAGCSGRSSASTATPSTDHRWCSPDTVAIESMGLATFGFGFGRADVWEPDNADWGPEDEWLGDKRYQGDRQLDNPLAAVQMGLIYVNPRRPQRQPRPRRLGRSTWFARIDLDVLDTTR